MLQSVVLFCGKMPEPLGKTRPKNQLATLVYATWYARKLMLANVCNVIAAVAAAAWPRQMTEVVLPRFVMVRRKRPTIQKQIAAELQQQQTGSFASPLDDV